MKKTLKLTAVSLVVCGVGVAALAFGQDRHPPPADPTTAASPQPIERTAEDTARRARAVARFGNVTITLGQVEDAINNMAPFMRARYNDPEKRREFVDSLIRFELMAQEAEKRHYGRDPDVVRAVKQNAVQQFIKAEFDDRITIESVPMADVQAYYNAHPEEFNRAEMRRASHILVGTREAAQALVAEARSADPTVFRALARAQSLDTETKLRGGDLGYFTLDPRPGVADEQIDPQLTHAAFALREVGDVSDPVQVGNQWSIIKLTGTRPAESRSVNDSAPSIRMRLWRERRTEALETFVTELRTRLHAEVHPELVNPIRLDPPPEGPGGMPATPGAPGAGPGTPPGHPPMPGAPPGHPPTPSAPPAPPAAH
ncbi:MAG: peptidyl-prolyl cis-trans isomerase [Sandaracinaceae bacterium]|nr:peptidyl-prolyl cis-trans isomerase [Sandaracinaceae bacterium]